LTLALTPALLPQILHVANASHVVNAGLERMKLASPVVVGARVRLSGEVRSAREMPGGGVRVALALRMEVEGSIKPACTAEAIYVYIPT
jgi:acyl dehydratase